MSETEISRLPDAKARELATPSSLPGGILLARAAVAAAALLLLAVDAYFGPVLLVGLLALLLTGLTAFEGSRPRSRVAKGAEDAPASAEHRGARQPGVGRPLLGSRSTENETWMPAKRH